MSGSNIFQRDKIPFQMLGEEYQYEFLPSIHLQEVMVGITNLLTSLSFDLDKDEKGEETVSVSMKEDADILPRALEIARELLSARIYQVIADVLQYQNKKVVSVAALKVGTRPSEIAQFMEILINDPEMFEAIASLGKSLAALMGKLTGRSQTEKSTPSLPTTSSSTENTSTSE